jgi:hydroxyacylglutathione hydrolase
VLPYNKPILLVLEEKEQLETAVSYLIRLGYDNIAGILKGGIAAWYVKALQIDNFNLISVHDLKGKLENGEKMVILDVRDKRKWDKGHINGARHIYVGHLEEKLDEVPKDWPVIVYCGTARSANLAASILKKNGYGKVYNVLGGMSAWKNAGYIVVK